MRRNYMPSILVSLDLVDFKYVGLVETSSSTAPVPWSRRSVFLCYGRVDGMQLCTKPLTI